MKTWQVLWCIIFHQKYHAWIAEGWSGRQEWVCEKCEISVGKSIKGN